MAETRSRATARALLIAALAALASSACSRGATSGADAAVTREAFAELGVDMDVPLGARVARRADAIEIRLRPNARYSPTIELTRTVADDDGGGDRLVLPGGGAVSFTTRRFESEGSGGPSAELAGVLHAKGAALRIRCTIQSDDAPPNPTWCLPILDGVHGRERR